MTVHMGYFVLFKSYKEPIPVYESIFEKFQEAFQIEGLTINEFKNLGGKIHLLGNISMLE